MHLSWPVTPARRDPSWLSAEEPDRVWAPGPAGPTLQLGLTVIPLRRRPVPPSLRAPSRLFTAAQPYSTELGQVTGLLLQLEEMFRFRFAISIWQEGSWNRRQQLCLSSIFSKVGFRLFGGGEISEVPQEHVIGILDLELRKDEHGSSFAKEFIFQRTG